MNIYQDVLAKVSQLVARGRGDRTARLTAVCEALSRLPGYDWVGFYFPDADARTLVLGPYVGEKTEHDRIPYGKGLCGQVAVSLKTYISPDVLAEDNYIACNADVRSEIVVPILDEGLFVGELDIDSNVPDRFDEHEQYLLEEICQRIVPLF